MLAHITVHTNNKLSNKNQMLLLLETVLLLEAVLLFFRTWRLTCACIRVRAINRVNTVFYQTLIFIFQF